MEERLEIWLHETPNGSVPASDWYSLPDLRLTGEVIIYDGRVVRVEVEYEGTKKFVLVQHVRQTTRCNNMGMALSAIHQRKAFT